MARPGIRGLTLLEMVVVLALMGVALALSVPSLVSSPATTPDPLQSVLDGARRAAVRRAESLALAIEADGTWTLEASDRLAPGILTSGRLEARPSGPLRLVASPLGACWIESGSVGPTGLALDPAQCRLVETSR